MRISRVAKTSEIRKQSFSGSSRCRRRPGSLELLALKRGVLAARSRVLENSIVLSNSIKHHSLGQAIIRFPTGK